VWSLHFIVLVTLLVLSAFFSSSETALFSLRSMQVQRMRQGGTRAARAIVALLQHPRRLLATILVGNTIVNIVMSVIAAGLFVLWFGADRGPLLATLAMSLVVLVFGEILPKSIAVGAPVAVARLVAPFLLVFQRLLQPLAASAAGLTDRMAAALERRVPRRDEVLSENEIKMLVTMGSEQGIVGVREKEFIHNVFQLNDRLVKDIVTPRTRVFTVDAAARVADVRHHIARAGYSRVPIYEGSVENLVGYVEVSDLLWGRDEPDLRRIRDLRRQLRFYPESKRVGELLLEMRRRGEEIAAVVDEHGAFDGIVSLEDAAEQVVGEIVDLHDLERFRIQELPGGALLVSAQLEIDLCNAILGTELQDADVETLGGLLSKRLGRIPAVGESLDLGGWRFTVEQAAPNRVQRLRLRRLQGSRPRRRRSFGGRA